MTSQLHAGLVFCALLLVVPIRTLAEPGPDQARPNVLLDVPYLAQPVRLCGGAALAMVLRYWGAKNVFAEDFAPLVDPARAGISTGALTRAVEQRGWFALAASATAATSADRLRTEVNLGRPVVALIEDRPEVYHFVVVVGVTDDVVVLHDPARAPFRVVPRAQFDTEWAGAERWMLVVLPPSGTTSPAATPVPPLALKDSVDGPASDTACTALVNHGVSAANAGDRDEAERGLVAATTLCPGDAAGWRELAGLRFLQSRYAEAQGLAERALRDEPADRHTWELLATARYLAGDSLGALDAWNKIGEPRTDVASIAGADRTPQPVIVDLMNLPPREVLTRKAFVRAGRQLDELPVASDTTLHYEPIDGGLATIQATIRERRLRPSWMDWVETGFEAAVRREVRLDVPGLMRAGENLRARYRWAANRPRVQFEFALPAPGRLPGIAHLEASWERQSYAALTPGEATLREDRRRAGASLSHWPVSWLRWEAGGAVDRFDDRGYVAVGGRLTTRWFGDRVFMNLTGERWIGTAPGEPFASSTLTTGWRWTRDRDRPNWTAVGGVSAATAAAPLALWPGASTGLGRGALLRAHRILNSGILTGEVFGRRLAFATVEHERPVWSSRHGILGIAGFLDTARAWQRREIGPSPLHADIGTGVRFGRPTGGTVRLDVAYGLHDRKTAVSAGYVSSWGQ